MRSLFVTLLALFCLTSVLPAEAATQAQLNNARRHHYALNQAPSHHVSGYVNGRWHHVYGTTHRAVRRSVRRRHR
jgi:hypothetical protein